MAGSPFRAHTGRDLCLEAPSRLRFEGHSGGSQSDRRFFHSYCAGYGRVVCFYCDRSASGFAAGDDAVVCHSSHTWPAAFAGYLGESACANRKLNPLIPLQRDRIGRQVDPGFVDSDQTFRFRAFDFGRDDCACLLYTSPSPRD